MLKESLPPGSHLVINHATSEVHGAASEEAVAHWNRFGKPSITLRTAYEITSFFDGFELLPPGVVSCAQWRPGHADTAGDPVDEFAGVARRPRSE